jgi:hypothetical protein
MGEIQAFTEEHVRAAADLNMRAIRGRREPAGAGLQESFREIFLGNPWATPDIPSLVYLDKGKLLGFLGVVPRPMEFQGKPIRVAVTSQFMFDREEHRGLGAIEMLRCFFRGPQDMSFTDGAGEGASVVWTAAGGRVARLYSFNWTRVLRPLETARSVLNRGGGPWNLLKGVSGVATNPGDFVLSKLPLDMLRRPDSPYSSKTVAAAELLQCIQRIGWRESLKPVYSQPSFNWLMSQAARTTILGNLRMLGVYGRDGLLAGWCVYYSKPKGAAYALQIGVRRQDHFKGTLLALFADAWDCGCAALKGQAIPQFLTQLTEQHCVFRHPNPSVLVHSRTADLVNLVESGSAAISRLDGECWIPLSSQS